MKVKFLIIRLSSIGDIVLTSPVIRALKTQVEDAEVHFFVKKQFAETVIHNPYIDKVHYFDGNLKANIEAFKSEGIDYVIDLHKNFRSLRVRNALKVPDFSFNKLNYEKWVAVRFKKLSLLPDVHIVDRYFDAVKPFDVANDHKGLDYFIDEEADRVALDVNDYVVLVAGAKHATKRIPVDLAVQIISGINRPVVILGGKEEVELANEIKQQATGTVLNFAGKLRLNQSAYVIRHAAGVITPDTGLMHIAAAYRKHIASVWGNTIPEFGMYPYMPGNKSRMFEVEGLRCRPCSKLGYEKCPKKHFDCMMQQPVDEIVQWANAL